jgi:uncharacterized protein YjdB
MVVCIGGTTTLTNSTGGGVWTSSIPADATVGSSTGIVTGVATGSPNITYAISSGCYKSSSVSVHTAPTAIAGTGAVCTSTPVTLTDGTASGSWSSSATTRATVSSTGVVIGHAAGTATISYSISGCTSATFPITVAACRIGGEKSPIAGNEDQGANVYSLYPNPGNGNITIAQSIVTDEKVDIVVLNYLGQFIFEGNLVFSQGFGQLYLENIVPGIYMVVITDFKGQSTTFRLMVEK